MVRALLLASLVAAVRAHFALTTAASGGAKYSTMADAYVVEQIDRSQFSDRVAFCEYPYIWFKFEKPDDFDKLMLGGTVPVIERFFDTRVAAAVIGPGLATDDTSKLPAAIVAQIPEGMGVVAVPGVPDLSTCDWMEDPMSTGESRDGVQPYSPSLGGDDIKFAAFHEWPSARCFYHEEWGGADMWMVQDKLVPLAGAGTYHIVFWSPGDQVLGEPTHTAKFGVVFGDVGQSEAFCGTSDDAGECSLPSQDYYENACRLPKDADAPVRSASCKPFYGVPVPNLYSCSAASTTAAADHCNTLCHNEGVCLPAEAVSCPGECSETCSYKECGVEDAAMRRGPLGPACPAGCSAEGRRSRRLLFGTYAKTRNEEGGCPPECMGDFHHDHSPPEMVPGMGGKMCQPTDPACIFGCDEDGTKDCAPTDYACIYGR